MNHLCAGSAQAKDVSSTGAALCFASGFIWAFCSRQEPFSSPVPKPPCALPAGPAARCQPLQGQVTEMYSFMKQTEVKQPVLQAGTGEGTALCMLLLFFCV